MIMFNRCRHFLAIVLLLALPLQSVAASAMLLCKMVHVNTDVIAAEHNHEHDEHNQSSEQGASSAHQCSACMVCSGFLALPVSMGVLFATHASYQYVEFRYGAHPKPNLEGPKRPPRALQA